MHAGTLMAPLLCAFPCVQVGPIEASLLCAVEHGLAVPIQLAAHVVPAHVELVTTRLDFGLVRLSGAWGCEVGSTHWKRKTCLMPAKRSATGLAIKWCGPSHACLLHTCMGAQPHCLPCAGSTTRTLTIRNASRTCPASWSLLEEVISPGPHLRALARQASSFSRKPGERTYLGFWPEQGVLGPGEEAQVEVTCYAQSDGQHHSVVKVGCWGGWAGGSWLGCLGGGLQG